MSMEVQFGVKKKKNTTKEKEFSSTICKQNTNHNCKGHG